MSFLQADDDARRREREKYVEQASKTIKNKSKKHTSLLKASLKGKDEKVVALLTKKDVDESENEETPLHIAASCGHVSTVTYLLLKGADVNAVDSKGQTAVHKAVCFDYPEVIKVLASHGADLDCFDHEGTNPIFLALSKNAPLSFVELVQCGADWKQEGPKGELPFLEAAAKGFTKGVKEMCERDPSAVNMQNTFGNTALHKAAGNAKTGVIAVLLGYKCATHLSNMNGQTAAELAMMSGYVEIANAINKAQDGSVTPRTSGNYTTPQRDRNISKGPTAKAIEREGMLWVLSKNRKKWKKHWFQAKGGLLFEFEKQGGKQTNLYNLLGSQVCEYLPEKYPFCFNIILNPSSPESGVILKADTQTEMSQWFACLQYQLAPSTTLRPSKVKDPHTMTQKQLKYNETSVLADITGGNWNDLLNNFSVHMEQKLYEQEWITLEDRELSKASETLSSEGHKICNRYKNRYPHIVPYDTTRVRLSAIEGVDGSDYINASYILVESHNYIVSQAPVPDTIEDFYKMAWEHYCPVMVMLTPLEENGKIKAHDYLPIADDSFRMQKFPMEISLESETREEHFTTREINFKRTDVDDSTIMTHFHYHAWNENGLPDLNSLSEMIHRVHAIAGKTPERPILVHCSGGVSQSGTFVLLSSCMLHFEDVLSKNKLPKVNVMKSTEHLRSQRGYLITHPDQYRFAYEFLFTQLQSLARFHSFAAQPKAQTKSAANNAPNPPSSGFEGNYASMPPVSSMPPMSSGASGHSGPPSNYGALPSPAPGSSNYGGLPVFQDLPLPPPPTGMNEMDQILQQINNLSSMFPPPYSSPPSHSPPPYSSPTNSPPPYTPTADYPQYGYLPYIPESIQATTITSPPSGGGLSLATPTPKRTVNLNRVSVVTVSASTSSPPMGRATSSTAPVKPSKEFQAMYNASPASASIKAPSSSDVTYASIPAIPSTSFKAPATSSPITSRPPSATAAPSPSTTIKNNPFIKAQFQSIGNANTVNTANTGNVGNVGNAGNAGNASSTVRQQFFSTPYAPAPSPSPSASPSPAPAPAPVVRPTPNSPSTTFKSPATQPPSISSSPRSSPTPPTATTSNQSPAVNRAAGATVKTSSPFLASPSTSTSTSSPSSSSTSFKSTTSNAAAPITSSGTVSQKIALWATTAPPTATSNQRIRPTTNNNNNNNNASSSSSISSRSPATPPPPLPRDTPPPPLPRDTPPPPLPRDGPPVPRDQAPTRPTRGMAPSLPPRN